MKPNISVYSRTGPEETKKLDGFVEAAFWIGVDHTEGDLDTVKIRLPSQSYDSDVASMLEFTSLLVQRQINFSVEFFTEPVPEPSSPVSLNYREEALEPVATGPSALQQLEKGDFDYETELAKIKEDYEKGVVSKKQFETKKGALLKRWKERVEGNLGG
ncbi:MAG TPA: hypothetical protein VLX33_02710 [Nitrososphaerales archaeon]|nr:hypothetical protein [Nitrososphaerales archaeon]